MERRLIKIGTRTSALALAQSALVRQALIVAHPEYDFKLIPAVTTGDYRRDKLNLQVEDKKQWVIEIERMLLDREIELAIHSAKDVPLNIESGTALKTVLARESALDLVCYRKVEGLKVIAHISELPLRARVGTSSKRRAAQLLSLRSDLQVVPLRGNVTTRIEKLTTGNEFDAIVIASAGVNRLNIVGVNKFELDIEQMIPAVGQGQLLAQYISTTEEIMHLLEAVSFKQDQLRYDVERLVIEALGADCHSCVGVNARIENGTVFHLNVIVLSVMGDRILRKTMTGSIQDAISLGARAASELINEGAENLLFPR